MSVKSSKSRLRVVGCHITEDEIRLLAKWRKKNNRFYPEQVKVTPTSMMWWYREHYVNQKRILFWVIGDKGEKIGHMGLYHFIDNSIDLDNVSRGDRKYKGIMSEALQELLEIGYRLAENIYLKVRADNDRAIRFYERNGFVKQEKVLYKNVLFFRMKHERSKNSG